MRPIWAAIILLALAAAPASAATLPAKAVAGPGGTPQPPTPSAQAWPIKVPGLGPALPLMMKDFADLGPLKVPDGMTEADAATADLIAFTQDGPTDQFEQTLWIKRYATVDEAQKDVRNVMVRYDRLMQLGNNAPPPYWHQSF